MGRYYKTAQPNFSQEFIYQPPWQLAQQALATKQQGYDDTLQSTEVVRDLLNVQHLDFEDERVKSIKDYYNNKIDELVNQVSQNPNSYNKALPAIRNLTREINSDRKEGDIANIERRHSAWQNWVKENQDILKEDPGLYNDLAKHWYNDIRTRGTEDVNASFSGVKGIAKPDINSKDMRDALKEFKANATEVSNGGYKINNEWLSEEEVQQAAYDLYMSNPNIQGYVNQMGNILKDPGFYDEETEELREIYRSVDSSGNPITGEEAKTLKEKWDKLPDTEKQEQGLPFSRQLNMQHSLSQGFRAWGNILGFQEQSLTEDKYGLEASKAANARKLQSQKDAESMKRLVYGKAADKDKLITNWKLKTDFEKEKLQLELELEASNGDVDAQKVLKILIPQQTLGLIPNKNNSYKEDIKEIKNKTLNVIPNKGTTTISQGGQVKDKVTQRVEQGRKQAKIKFSKNKEALEYIEYLNGRIPTENSAKEFLESKGVYQTSNEQSVAGEFINNNRFSMQDDNPLFVPIHVVAGGIGIFTKDEAAKKWDNIYKIGLEYEEEIQNWYEEQNSTPQQVTIYPFNKKGKESILQELNSMEAKNNYFTVDKEGKEIPFIGVSDIIGGTGANTQSGLAYQVKDLDGKSIYVFPKPGNENVMELSKNLTMMALNEKNNPLFEELEKGMINNISMQLEQGNVLPNGTKSTILDLFNTKIILRSTPQGTLEVLDSYGNEVIGEYRNIKSLVKKIRE